MEKREKETGQVRRSLGGGLLAACTLLLAPVIALAQAPAGILTDPMRPADARPATRAAAASEPQSSGGPQVILISAQRKLAVIDGTVVPLGAAAREGTLVGLTDSAAVLSKDGSQDVLLMHPNIEKKPSASARKTQP